MAKSHSSKTHPSLDRKPGKSNWVDEAGDLPEYIDAVAKHIHYDSGLSISHSIAAAVEKCKKDAAKGNARAIKSLAEWERMKASRKGKGKKAVKLAKSVKSYTKKQETTRDRQDVNARKTTSFRTVGGVRSAVAGQHVKTRNRNTNIGSKREWEESKYVRDQGGRFGNKISPSQLNAARRTVASAINALQIGASVNLPGGIGWVQRTEGGYMIQGDAGQRVVVRSASEAVEAAANVLAAKLNPKG